MVKCNFFLAATLYNEIGIKIEEENLNYKCNARWGRRKIVAKKEEDDDEKKNWRQNCTCRNICFLSFRLLVLSKLRKLEEQVTKISRVVLRIKVL